MISMIRVLCERADGIGATIASGSAPTQLRQPLTHNFTFFSAAQTPPASPPLRSLRSFSHPLTTHLLDLVELAELVQCGDTAGGEAAGGVARVPAALGFEHRAVKQSGSAQQVSGCTPMKPAGGRDGRARCCSSSCAPVPLCIQGPSPVLAGESAQHSETRHSRGRDSRLADEQGQQRRKGAGAGLRGRGEWVHEGECMGAGREGVCIEACAGGKAEKAERQGGIGMM